MSGLQSPPQPFGGTISQSGNTLTLDAPLQLTFPLSDPGSGITADFTVQGTFRADYTAPTPSSYCSSVPNSSGAAGTIQASGSQSIFDGNLTLDAANLPPLSLGYFIFSETQGFSTGLGGGQGNLCVGPNVGRYLTQFGSTGFFGTLNLVVDTSAIITASGPVAALPGDTYNFQCWFRSGASFDLSDGLSLSFQP